MNYLNSVVGQLRNKSSKTNNWENGGKPYVLCKYPEKEGVFQVKTGCHTATPFGTRFEHLFLYSLFLELT